jgi:hypothetical protein
MSMYVTHLLSFELESRFLPPALNCLGIGLGAAALLSAVPGLRGKEVVAGLLQIGSVMANAMKVR